MKIALSLSAILLSSAVQAESFRLTSPDLPASAPIPEKHVFKGFGCDGGNVSPALAWKGAPQGTKSFALTVYDPDAPTGSGWWHWLVVNIPAETNALPAGAGDPAAGKAPAAALQTRTDFGSSGWGGPCPPKADKPHRYIFTVHALKTDKIEIPADAPGAMVGYMINANSLGKASFTARYGRK
ncbi:MAG: YbhB/YbcL family Raf kinase inhibitor-like protein [Rhodocyclaceae bacterium]|nr:YbhB/YbcL family Raf kinase inhibitor-like protein [Rhodocyclaceae bacterium]MBX3668693.1 YbhB/YbcL family Raf kinase inhibitor-like protein [Rhodocyclaceae bacterium]